MKALICLSIIMLPFKVVKDNGDTYAFLLYTYGRSRTVPL